MAKIRAIVSGEPEKARNLVVVNRVVDSRPAPLKEDQFSLTSDQASALEKFNLFWTMMDTVKAHGYLSAAMSLIGRSTVSAWFSLAKHSEFKNQATERQRKKLYSFYYALQREWSNIYDYVTVAQKVMVGIMYLRYFGQVAYRIVRNNAGQPISFDHLAGYMVPNVDAAGNFKSPAFVHYPTKDLSVSVPYNDPFDVIYITNPDWSGNHAGGSDIQALASFTLPLDIYLQTAAREYLGNSAKPELIYMLPADITDEAFNAFVAMLQTKYAGPSNLGKNPIAVQGDLKVERIDRLPSDLPYQEAREGTRQETLAVSGTGNAMLGVDDGGDIREQRRNFFEQTILPLVKFVEQGFYDQIHLREFSSPGWVIRFNNPDFLTAVERATVHMRYIQTGVYSPNDVRDQLGMEPREGGDVYAQPGRPGTTQPKEDEEENEPGSPPEGREEESDSPENIGEPTLDDQDPPRGDQKSIDSFILRDTNKDELLMALREWKRYAVSRIKRSMKLRPYVHTSIPIELGDLIQTYLDEVKSIEEVRSIFSLVIRMVESADE